MMISEVLSKAKRNKSRKRVGRGHGSGNGKTAGRGHKGFGQHAGKGSRKLAEGGAFPLFRRIPKRGFSNADFRVEYQVVNIGSLEERFEAGTHVTPALLKEAGLIRDAKGLVKVLGTGEVTKKFEVEANKFSASASRKITEVGGKVVTPGS